MIRTVIVVGTGLIGTSVALAARRAGVTVYLSDRDLAAARVAEALGAGVAQPPRHPVDLAVLAVPPAHVGPVLRDAQAAGLALSYTDVASVKGEPERMALSLAPDPAAYVGGHPMAGRERSGPMAATADLFAGRAWVLTPSARTGRVTTERATSLATLCGAVPVLLSSRAHDEAVALTSHLPHLMASLTAARICDGPAETSRLAGQGLRDVTRIAAGAPALWADIVRSNAPAIAAVLRGVQADLSRLVPAVEALAHVTNLHRFSAAGGNQPDGPDRAAAERTVLDLLERGTAGVSRTRAVAAGPTGVRFRVALRRRPGELARLLTAAAAFGVAADAVTAELGAGGELIVRCTVSDQMADLAQAGLLSSGWDIEPEEPGDRHSDSAPSLVRANVELSNAVVNSASSQLGPGAG